MRKIVYCKFNMNRSPLFQTKTAIIDDDGERYIEKTPVTKAGSNHILKFEENYNNTQKIYPNLDLLKPVMKDDGVVYPFIKGTPIEELYLNDKNTVDDLIKGIKEILDKYLIPSEECFTDFELSEDFKKCFGEVDCSTDICIKPCNIDMIFDNLIVVDSKPVVFDYEWVFDIPIPKDYVLYRILCHIYDKRFDMISEKLSITDFISEFGIEEESQNRYRTMENSFMEYVFGDGNPAFSGEEYLHERKKISDYDFYQNGYTEAVELLHETEEKLVNSIDELEKTSKRFFEARDRYNEAVEILHKTENQLIDTIKIHQQLCDDHNQLVKNYNNLERVNSEFESQNTQLLSQIKIYEDMISQKDDYITGLENQLSLVVNSMSWKITKPLRGVKKVIKCNPSKNNTEIVEAEPEQIDKNEEIQIDEDVTEQVDNEIDDYETIKKRALDEYIIHQNKVLEEELSNTIETKHKISLITPLFNTPQKYLVDLLESVINQKSGAWELCLVDFSDKDNDYIDKICTEYSEKDNRIVYVRNQKNEGISINSNICASYATGDYIGVLDHDDYLHQYAIAAAIKAIENDGADFLYSDEAKFEENIEDVNYPNLKPDFTADELRAHNFICHFNVFKKELFDKVGGYREGFDGSQDHDLVLRLTEISQKIVHIPYILYYWRVHDNSVAKCIEAKPYATRAGEKSITEQLKRMGVDQYAESVINNIPLYRLKTNEIDKAGISFVVWGSKNDDEYEATKEYLNSFDGISVYNAEEYSNDFNKIIDSIDSRYICFTHCGIRIDVEKMQNEVGLYSYRSDVASIDSKILDEDNSILSGGAYFGGEDALPIMVRCMGGSSEYSGYEANMLHTRPVVVSLGLCTIIDKDIWNNSGFNVSNKSIMDSVIEYSDYIRNKGYVNLIIPFYEVKSESISVKDDLISTLNNCKFEKQNDPYFNTSVFGLKLE